MFDVHWTDPNVESVGQRRARKKAEKAEKEEKSKEDEKTGRTSVSTRSSSSSADKAFGFFGGKGSKKSSTTSTTKLSQLRTPSITPSIETKPARNPLLITPVSVSHSGHPPPVQHTEGNYAPERVVESGGTSPADRSSRDSVFSGWTDRSGATVASVSGASVAGSAQGKSYLQDLGGGSYVTKTTEYTFENQTSEAPAKNLLSGITITADPNPEAPTSPIFQSYQSPPSTPRLERPLLQRSPSAHSSAPTLRGRHPRETMPLPPIPNYALAKFSKTQKEKKKWKAPDAWESNTTEAAADTSTSTIEEEDEMILPSQNEEDNVFAFDLTTMQRQIKKMATASAAEIWVRLHEVWGDENDPNMIREIELERKRWMLAAIHQLDVKTPNDQINSIFQPKNVPMVTKILALFECPAIASYVASLRNYAPVFHLSAQPLSHKVYPNIHPIQCPTVTSAALSVAPQSFREVYCLRLPSLIPSSDIPQMLRSIHRCLAPGGCLRLILVDPAPIASSMGPLMRAWLEKHLLLNLELKFRCMNPTKLFPRWLHEVHLRGKGSTIVHPRFKAIPPELKQDPDPRKPVDCTYVLYSRVGKMLWKEVWGDYVTAEKWWWEDRAIVEECIAHNTTWDYNIITAVREDPE